MKKETGKKLSLSKIRIAGLSAKNQQSIKGGMVNPPTKSSKCPVPLTKDCTTHYTYCGCY